MKCTLFFPFRGLTIGAHHNRSSGAKSNSPRRIGCQIRQTRGQNKRKSRPSTKKKGRDLDSEGAQENNRQRRVQ